jgi:hypothetical protein
MENVNIQLTKDEDSWLVTEITIKTYEYVDKFRKQW